MNSSRGKRASRKLYASSEARPKRSSCWMPSTTLRTRSESVNPPSFQIDSSCLPVLEPEGAIKRSAFEPPADVVSPFSRCNPLLFEDQNRRGNHRGPEAAFVADAALGDVGG